MSLKRKIALSFLISAFVIAVLTAFEYYNFIEIRKQIRYLELTDTIRTKSLQIRRYEKNFFLYPEKGEQESASVRAYIRDLKNVLAVSFNENQRETIALRNLVNDYERRFDKIESSSRTISGEFKTAEKAHTLNRNFIPAIESSFLDRPLQSAEFLQKIFRFSPNHRLIIHLRELDTDIESLRKTGEDIITTSRELDSSARRNAESEIHISQVAILILFPLFFIVGIVLLFFISTNVVKRLILLIDLVETTGKGSFPHVALDKANTTRDEVGLLIDKFNTMEDQLADREQEIDRKNRELNQTRKLAAIGTLASGVAHELNNPLNNIYLSAQVLSKEAGEACPVPIQEAVTDIIGQTARVKRIVNDLLEFARGRELRFDRIELNELIAGAYKQVTLSYGEKEVEFSLISDPSGATIQADRSQLEQVFINLFTNAIDAISERGKITVTVNKAEDESAIIKISDTGKGIARESIDKIFEPFFTTKGKGTGLGLAIVFNVIKKHAGDITVESEEGKGTTFTITLPAQRT